VTGPGRLSYETFDTQGGSEWLLRMGADGAPLLIIPPLLEEMNRTRALLATTMRRLSGAGFQCWMPDLPGTGESERALDRCAWDGWAGAVADAALHIERVSGRLAGVASFRGGALLDDTIEARCFWRFAPVAGASLVRDLERSTLVGAAERGTGGRSLLAGYPFSDELLQSLRAAEPQPVAPVRVVRLTTDPAEADGKIDGSALWRRSEPGNSPALAAAMAEDLASWIVTCAAS